MKDETWEGMSEKVAKIMEDWPEDKFDNIDAPESEWHLDAFKIVNDFVYEAKQDDY